MFSEGKAIRIRALVVGQNALWEQVDRRWWDKEDDVDSEGRDRGKADNRGRRACTHDGKEERCSIDYER